MQTRHHPLPSPSLGTRRELQSFHFGQPGQGQKAYIQAALHADELPGMLVAWHLKRQLQEMEAAGRLAGEVIVVPVANPLGLDQSVQHVPHGRFDLASGENFNRHYPAVAEAVFEELKEQLGADPAANVRLIRAALHRQVAAIRPSTELGGLRRELMLLACDADVVLDLHCDAEAVLHLFTGTPLWPQCEPLARYLGAETTLLATESGDNPFDEALSQSWWLIDELARRYADASRRPPPEIPMACLSVTVEHRSQTAVSHELAIQDAGAILAFLTHRGIVTGEAPPLPPLQREATPLAASEDLIAPHAGLLVYRLEPGRQVAAGEVVAEIIDPLSDQVSPIAATRAGVLYGRQRQRYATTGMLIAKVAGTKPFKAGKLLTA